MVASLDHVPVPLTTLDEIRDFLASGAPFCYWLQDMQMPHSKGARPHEKVGESSMRMVRSISTGPVGVVLLVVTGFRNDSAFVFNTSRLQADDFIEKSAIEALPDRILYWLKEKGREDHASCAACNARSRPMDSAPPAAASGAAAPRARLLSHEDKGARLVTEAEIVALAERRRGLDLFLNALAEEPAGFRAGCTDLKGRYRDVFLPKTSAEIVAELVEERKPVRATALRCLKAAGLGGNLEGAVRLVQQARKLVDAHAIVNGRESQKRWRAFHTVGEKNATAFWFDPPAGFRWGVVVRSESPADSE
jgi:hypothetical protein